MKVYIVMTERPYEGSWIEKIFSTQEDAQKFISNPENITNDELVIHEKEVETNNTFITIGDKELIFFDIAVRNKTNVCIDYNFEIFMKHLEKNLRYVIENENTYIVSKKCLNLLAKFNKLY